MIQFSRHKNMTQTDSVFVVIMSHGRMDSVFGTDGEEYKTDQIYQHLNIKTCPALRNKPKIIIIQASRGGDSM